MLDAVFRGFIMAIGRFAGFSTTDPTAEGAWRAVNFQIWTILEAWMYLIAACLPSFRLFVVYLVKRGSTLIRQPGGGDDPSGRRGTADNNFVPNKGLGPSSRKLDSNFTELACLTHVSRGYNESLGDRASLRESHDPSAGGYQILARHDYLASSLPSA